MMNTFRNKQFKNQLDPKYVFYDSLLSCELKSTSEKSLERSDWNPFLDDLDP